MPAWSRGRALPQREGRDHGGVGAAPAENDIGAGLERLEIGLGSHQRDDVQAFVDGRLVQLALRGQRGDLAGLQLLPDDLVRLLGIEHGDARRVVELPGQLEHDVLGPVDIEVAAGLAAGADQDRNAGLLLRRHQQLEIVPDGAARVLGFAGGEIGGAAVGRAGVERDRMRLARQRPLHLGGIEADPQRPLRHVDSDGPVQFFLCHLSPFLPASFGCRCGKVPFGRQPATQRGPGGLSSPLCRRGGPKAADFQSIVLVSRGAFKRLGRASGA
jgi:hypothetical protein